MHICITQMDKDIKWTKTHFLKPHKCKNKQTKKIIIIVNKNQWTEETVVMQVIFGSISLSVVVRELPFLKSIDGITVLKIDASFKSSFQTDGLGMTLYHHMIRLDRQKKGRL